MNYYELLLIIMNSFWCFFYFVGMRMNYCQLLGIISFKMKGQDYNFIFKGGKSVQFVLSEIQGSSKYISDDIDILITSNTQDVYNEEIMKNLSEHILSLLHR